MDFPSLPFPRRVAPALAVALLLAGTAPLSADDLTRSIDRAGNAINRQLGDWLGVAPERPTKRRATAQRAATTKPANAPLPPTRPEEAGKQAALPPEPDKAPAPKPEVKPDVVKEEAPKADTAKASAESGANGEAAKADVAKPETEAKANPVEAKPEAPKSDTAKLDETKPVEAKPAPEPKRAAAEPPSASDVPLPPPAPDRLAALPPPAAGPAAEAPRTARPAPVATICPELSNEDLGVFAPTEVKTTETACTLDRGVTLSAVRMKDGRLVELQPAAELRCEMAASVAHWLREKVEPAVATLGSPLDKVLVAGSLQCRPRNHVAGAKISEHGRGNALDTRGYVLKDGRRFVIGPPSSGSAEKAMPLDFQEKLKASACADFTTILGPGSDGYHEQHLHVDRATRRSGAVLCQWATARVEAVPPKPPSKPAEAKPEAPAASDAPEPDDEPEGGATPESAGKSQ